MPSIITRPSVTALVLAAALAFCGCANQQTASDPVGAIDPQLHAYVDAMRADLKRGKVDTINGIMRLSDAEAARFWPIYQDFEEEYFAVGDRRIALLTQYLKLNTTGAFNDRAASEIATGLINCEADRVTLYKKYFSAIETELSTLRAVQFLQIEHRFETIVDLLVASEMPLANSFHATGNH